MRQRFLRLVEQPHVFDRDHGLVGEGLQQLNVVIAELAGRRARHADHANRLVSRNKGQAARLRKPRSPRKMRTICR